MEVTKWNTHHLVPIMHHPMVKKLPVFYYYWRGSSFAGFRFFKFGIEVGNDRKDDNKK
jgi:hypothetical protein